MGQTQEIVPISDASLCYLIICTTNYKLKIISTKNLSKLGNVLIWVSDFRRNITHCHGFTRQNAAQSPPTYTAQSEHGRKPEGILCPWVFHPFMSELCLPKENLLLHSLCPRIKCYPQTFASQTPPSFQEERPGSLGTFMKLPRRAKPSYLISITKYLLIDYFI